MDASLLKRPSAIIPLTMSAAALAVIIGYVAMFGTARRRWSTGSSSISIGKARSGCRNLRALRLG